VVAEEQSDEPEYGSLIWREDEHAFEDLDPVGTWRHRLQMMERVGNTAEVERMLTARPPLGYGLGAQDLCSR
jgi:hypothetical protein